MTQIENHQLTRLIRLAEDQIRLSEAQLRVLLVLARENAPPFLSRIHLVFKGDKMPTLGPVTLTTAGQQVTASVLGFDQFGQPFTGEMPAATLSSDDSSESIIQFDPTTGQVTAVANGVANITANLVTAEGLSLSDTESVTVNIAVVPPPAPVLSSIKVAF